MAAYFANHGRRRELPYNELNIYHFNIYIIRHGTGTELSSEVDTRLACLGYANPFRSYIFWIYSYFDRVYCYSKQSELTQPLALNQGLEYVYCFIFYLFTKIE
jgi:hypothetical protein